MEFSVVNDADIIGSEFQGTSFSLKKDLKDITQDELNELSLEIADELTNSPRPPASVIISKSNKHNEISCMKMRIRDAKRGNGKSKGYRIYLIVDKINYYAYVLHIYRHEHGEKADISQKDKNILRVLLNEYSNNID